MLSEWEEHGIACMHEWYSTHRVPGVRQRLVVLIRCGV